MVVQKQPSPLIKNIDLNAGQMGNRNKEKPTLNEALEQIEGMEAEELLQSKARSVRAEYDLKTRETENRLRHIEGGVAVDDDTKKQEEAKTIAQREKLTASAKSLIDSGMEPAQVGQMLMGLTPTGVVPIPAQGMGFKEVMELVGFVVGKQETDSLKAVIASLEKKVDDVTRGGGVRVEAKPVDPITFAKQQAEAVSAWYKAIQEITPKPPTVTEKGEPLEVVKEKNRHEERLEEMRADRDYKGRLTEIAGDIPERIGRGLAGQFAEGEGSGGGSDGLEYIECEDCHTKFPIPPNTGSQVTCPQCSITYQRKEGLDSKV